MPLPCGEGANLSQTVCSRLARALLAGQFKPVSKISEPSLSAMLGVSRAPIREALIELERRGLVEFDASGRPAGEGRHVQGARGEHGRDEVGQDARRRLAARFRVCGEGASSTTSHAAATLHEQFTAAVANAWWAHVPRRTRSTVRRLGTRSGCSSRRCHDRAATSGASSTNSARGCWQIDGRVIRTLGERRTHDIGFIERRMGWDSNPRATFAAAGFQDRCIQPLCHPSSANRSRFSTIAAARNFDASAATGLLQSTEPADRHEPRCLRRHAPRYTEAWKAGSGAISTIPLPIRITSLHVMGYLLAVAASVLWGSRSRRPQRSRSSDPSNSSGPTRRRCSRSPILSSSRCFPFCFSRGTCSYRC